jgi:hypothetical protein
VAPPSSRTAAPEVTVERRIVEPEPDLATTLHDEVSFFTVGEDARLHEAAPVAVSAVRPEPLRVAEAPVDEGPSYAVAPPPEPRIIAYDAAATRRSTTTCFRRRRTAMSRSTPAAAASSPWGLIAALLAAAAALGAWAVWGGDDGSTSTSSVSPGAAQAIELIGQPGAQRVAVNGSNGQMVLVTTPNGRAVLILYGLKQAPAGKEYQAWIVTGKTPKSAGLFKGGGTTVVIPLAQRIRRARRSP